MKAKYQAHHLSLVIFFMVFMTTLVPFGVPLGLPLGFARETEGVPGQLLRELSKNPKEIIILEEIINRAIPGGECHTNCLPKNLCTEETYKNFFSNTLPPSKNACLRLFGEHIKTLERLIALYNRNHFCALAIVSCQELDVGIKQQWDAYQIALQTNNRGIANTPHLPAVNNSNEKGIKETHPNLLLEIIIRTFGNINKDNLNGAAERYRNHEYREASKP